MDFEVVDPFGPEPIAPPRSRGNGHAAPRAGAGPAQSPMGLALERLRQAAVGPEEGRFTTAEMEAQAPETVEWCLGEALKIVQSIDDESLSRTARRAFDRDPELIAGALLNELFGLGQLEELLHTPGVEDIAINGPRDVWYKGRGGWIKSDLEYPDSQTLLAVLNRAIVHSGRQAGPLTPIVDAALRTGHRINIVTDPLAHPWPVASIRLHRFHGFTLTDLVSGGGEAGKPPEPPMLPDYSAFDGGTGLLTALSATFLHMTVVAGLNLLVVGPTGVGKTTVLGALGRMIPPDKRIVLIEDTPELNFRGGQEDSRVQNAVYFRTRVASVEGLPPVAQRDLVLAALRQRPDALTIGEARGAEVFEMLKALWTGHRNGLTSIHADSIEDVPSRIRMMLQEAHFETEVSETTVALWISKAFHLGITLREANARQRYVEEITEFTGGVEGTAPVRTPLFVYDHTQQRLVCTGHRLDGKHEAMLNQVGCNYDDIVEAARERGELQ